MKQNYTAIAIIILAISILASSLIIANSLSLTSEDDSSRENVLLEKQFLSKGEISEYLGITVEQFDELNKQQIINGRSPIPYIEIDNEKYFTIKSVSEWLLSIDTYSYFYNQ